LRAPELNRRNLAPRVARHKSFATHPRHVTRSGGLQRDSPGAVAGYFFARFKV